MTPELSVIIPVYNVEKYLKIAVDSVLRQSLKEIKVYLVDDGSPDGCAKICDEYAAKDPRVIVIHRKNGGLADARNIALNLLDTPYVAFLDSDDSLSEERAFEYVLDQMKATDADMALFGYKPYVGEDAPPIGTEALSPKTYAFDKEKLPDWLLENISSSHPLIAWDKIYRSELFRSARFEPDSLVEDSRIMPSLYSAANRFVRIEGQMVWYRTRENSQSNVRSVKLCCDHILSTLTVCRFAKETGNAEYANETAIRWVNDFFLDYADIINQKAAYQDTPERKAHFTLAESSMRAYFKSFYPDLMKKGRLSRRKRFCCRVFRIWPHAAVALARRLNAFDC